VATKSGSLSRRRSVNVFSRFVNLGSVTPKEIS
jgi:hypothetical protein